MEKNSLFILFLFLASLFTSACNKETRPTIYLPKVTEPEITQNVSDFNEKWITKESKENVKNITLWLLDIETRNILQRKRIKYLESLLNYEPEKTGNVNIEKKAIKEIDEEYKIEQKKTEK